MKILHFLVISSAIFFAGCAASSSGSTIRDIGQNKLIFPEIPENIKKNYYKVKEIRCQTEGVIKASSYDDQQYTFKGNETPYCLAELKEEAMIVDVAFTLKINAISDAALKVGELITAPLTILRKMTDKDQRDPSRPHVRVIGFYGKGSNDTEFIGKEYSFAPGYETVGFTEPFADKMVHSVLSKLTSVWRPKSDRGSAKNINWSPDELKVTYIPRSNFAKMSIDFMTKNNDAESNEKFLRMMLKADPSMLDKIKQAQNVKLPADSIIYSE